MIDEEMLSEHKGNVASGNASTNEVKDDKDESSTEWRERILKQRKSDQEKAKLLEQEKQELAAKLKAIEDEKLQEQGNYKKLLENREAELEAERNKTATFMEENKTIKSEMIEAYKLDAFESKLPHKIRKPEYRAFIPLEDIAIDPETGKIDKSTLDSAVNKFMEDYSDLVGTGLKGSLPNQAAKGSGDRSLSSLSLDEKIKLLVSKS